MDHEGLHRRARERGANTLVYWLVRAFLQPFFLVYFRLSRIGREHIPADGPVILASNHRSFLDPFVIATMARRPMYYVAKKELFMRGWQAWILNVGTEAIRRGWRIRPYKVGIRAGRALRFPTVPDASPALASAITERIWPA